MNASQPTLTTLNFRTVASPQTKVVGSKGHFKKFTGGDSIKEGLVGLASNCLINVLIKARLNTFVHDNKCKDVKQKYRSLEQLKLKLL